MGSSHQPEPMDVSPPAGDTIEPTEVDPPPEDEPMEVDHLTQGGAGTTTSCMLGDGATSTGVQGALDFHLGLESNHARGPLRQQLLPITLPSPFPLLILPQDLSPLLS